jgi:hypothetical protein
MEELSIWFECFDRNYQKKDKDLYEGAWCLIDARIVNGVQTLGIKSWGWR